MRERVFITGIGAVTPAGIGADQSWAAVRDGRSAVSLIEGIDVSDLPIKVAGEIKNFSADGIISAADQKRLDLHAQFAIVAGLEAAADADAVARDAIPSERFGVSVGTSAGPAGLFYRSQRALDTKGPRGVPAGVVIYGGADSAAAYLSMRLGLRGQSTGVSATCASGAQALGEAMRSIRHGYVDAQLVVGADDCLHRVNLSANSNIGALVRDYSADPTGASRPFDLKRSGFVMSQGAAAVLLESESSAKRRGAKVLAELSGFGASSDAHHATAPRQDGLGAAAAMEGALADAGLRASEISHVNLHGTGTQLGDAAEYASLLRVFGADHIPAVTANKSSVGHMLGAAGVFEVVLSVFSLREQLLTPTLNLDSPEFPLDFALNEARSMRVDNILSNSFGFGGHNASLVIGNPYT